MSKFNTGDWAFTLRCGWAKIKRSGDDIYPIDHSRNHYTEEGKYMTEHEYPYLFTVSEAEMHRFPDPPKEKEKVYKHYYKARACVLEKLTTQNWDNMLLEAPARIHIKTEVIGEVEV